MEAPMAVTAFAAPILPGKTDAWRNAMAEMTGPRSAEFEAWNHRLGLTRHMACLQETPHGDFVVVYAEGEAPATIVDQTLASEHPFDRWFAEAVLQGVHGIDPAEGSPPANEVVVNWSA
jgi:hypothetical protein